MLFLIPPPATSPPVRSALSQRAELLDAPNLACVCVCVCVYVCVCAHVHVCACVCMCVSFSLSLSLSLSGGTGPIFLLKRRADKERDNTTFSHRGPHTSLPGKVSQNVSMK